MIVAVAYLRTGFDIINVPADPALLRSCASNTLQFPALDILNKRFLSSVRVKVNPTMYDESWIEQIDYIELKEENSNADGIFYYVQSYSYTSKDVVTFNIVQDSILSCGGIKIIRTIYARRAHIAKSQDKFGAFDADDELLIPKEPLLLVHGGSRSEFKDTDGVTAVGYNDGKSGMFFQFMNAGQWGSGEGQQTVVVSTVGLAQSDDPSSYLTYSGGMQTFGTWGITDYSEQAAGRDTRWPKIPNSRGITVEMPQIYRDVKTLVPYSDSQYLIDRKIPYSGLEYNILGTQVYSYYSSIEALDVLRAVGMENSIIACYRLRRGEGQLSNDTPGKLPNKLIGKSYIYSTNGWTSSGAWTGEGGIGTNSGRTQSGSEPYDYDFLGYGIKNMRVLYGQFRKYVLASPATGSSLTAKPEELTSRRFTADYSQSGTTGKNGSPYVCCFTDPRPTGRPYYNFIKFGQLMKQYSNSNASVVNLGEGAVAGGQWPEVPIVFTGMSGEWAAKIGYDLDASYKDYQASAERTYRDLIAGAEYSADRANTQAQGNILASGVWAHLGVDTRGILGAASTGSEVGSNFDHATGSWDEWVGEDAGSYTSYSSSGSIGGGLIGAAAKLAANMAKTEISLYAARNLSEANAQNAVNAAIGAAGRQAFAVDDSNVLSLASQGNIAANRILERQWAAAYEKAKFNLSTSYSTPRLKFMSTDSMRDLTNNGVFYARYTPTSTDLARMDNILQAFGYKVDMLMDNPIGNRDNFVYIEGTVEKFNDFIRVGNNDIPKVIRKDMMLDINNQLANGVRVWKVNPKNANVYDPG